jgi:hypothetical protein
MDEQQAEPALGKSPHPGAAERPVEAMPRPPTPWAGANVVKNVRGFSPWLPPLRIPVAWPTSAAPWREGGASSASS